MFAPASHMPWKKALVVFGEQNIRAHYKQKVRALFTQELGALCTKEDSGMLRSMCTGVGTPLRHCGDPQHSAPSLGQLSLHPMPSNGHVLAKLLSVLKS